VSAPIPDRRARVAPEQTRKHAARPTARAVRRAGARIGGWHVLLCAALLASAVTTYRLRAAAVPSAPVPAPASVVAAPAPVLRTPIAHARQVRGARDLEIDGASAVWEAPPLPAPALGPRAAGGRIALAAPGALPRTPAGDVDRWVYRFAAADQRAEMKRYLERMARYEPLIAASLAERRLPRDLLYLALIESGFSPRATSRSGAAGIWQFMPETARQYGLEVSEYVDERRDPIRSTRAAWRHLVGLHRHFGSWHLAAAAYNAGDGRVGETVLARTGARGGREALYWMVRPWLPDETQAYVPKLLAASRIARDPARYGFDDLTPAEPLRFREVEVPGGVPLEAVARAAGAPAEAVYELNPHLIRRTTPPGRSWPVRIPARGER
jgi:membrane-bound lytic murein transglycosylase D